MNDDNSEREPGLDPCATCGKLKGHDETAHRLVPVIEQLRRDLSRVTGERDEARDERDRLQRQQRIEAFAVECAQVTTSNVLDELVAERDAANARAEKAEAEYQWAVRYPHTAVSTDGTTFVAEHVPSGVVGHGTTRTAAVAACIEARATLAEQRAAVSDEVREAVAVLRTYLGLERCELSMPELDALMTVLDHVEADPRRVDTLPAPAELTPECERSWRFEEGDTRSLPIKCTRPALRRDPEDGKRVCAECLQLPPTNEDDGPAKGDEVSRG